MESIFSLLELINLPSWGVLTLMTQSRFWRRKSSPKIGTDFWTVCHTDLVPDFSGTRFWRWSVAFYFVLISGMHVTTMATNDCSIPLFSFCLYSLVIFCLLSILASSMLILGADFSYQITSGTKNRRQKSAPISGVCVISLRIVKSMSVCLSIHWHSLRTHSWTSQFLCACPCLDSPLVALYFRYCGWCHVFTQRPYGAWCVFRSGDRIRQA